jgi:hypothetical protein
LFALLLASGEAGPLPKLRAIGLLEPPGRRYLDVVAQQVEATIAADEEAGRVSSDKANQVRGQLGTAVQTLRNTGNPPTDLTAGLKKLFNPATNRFLAELDRSDPAQLATELRPGFPVLVTCSDSDVQEKCTDVARVASALNQKSAATASVQLVGVNHVLKQDPSRDIANYGKPLPSSPQMEAALREFVAANLLDG